MINNTLTYLKEYLTGKIPEAINGINLDALNRDEQAEGDIVLTLVRIEEDRSNPSPDFYRFTKGIAQDGKEQAMSFETVNPPVILNLYMLVSAQAEPYETALTLISKVIGAFQEKRFFSEKDFKEKGLDNSIESLSIDLFSPTYEQNNSLWQTLGVKLMPAVMYKVRAIAIASGLPVSESSPTVLPRDTENKKGGIALIKYGDLDKASHENERKKKRKGRKTYIH